MKVISTNIGETKTVSWKGKDVKSGIFKYPVSQSIFLGNTDVENDNVIDRRYHGGKDKACYLYASDHYSYWQEMYPGLDMPWGMFGENLTIEGCFESEINIGDVFKLGETIVQATQPRQPCFKLEFRFHDKDIVRKFVEADFPGVYVRILQVGNVKTGDNMELIERQDSVSIAEVYKMLYASDFYPEINKAVNDPFIAESCKKDLAKRWEEFL